MPGKFGWPYGRRVPIEPQAQPYRCAVCQDAGCLLCTGRAAERPAPTRQVVRPPDWPARSAAHHGGSAAPQPAPQPLPTPAVPLLPPPPPPAWALPSPPWMPVPRQVLGAGWLLYLVDQRRAAADNARLRARLGLSAPEGVSP